MWALALLSVVSFGQACSPSPINMCVTWAPDGFYFNRFGTPEKLPSLELNARTPFTFELVGSFAAHPFVLTLNSTGGPSVQPFVGDGVNGNNPATQDQDKLLFTPPSTGESKLYFQSTADLNWGIPIQVPGACKPSKYNICLTPSWNSATYMWDNGNGPQTPDTEIVLTADETYRWEIAGPLGIAFPVALSSEDVVPITADKIYSVGVDTTTYPLTTDDTSFTFLADRKGPSTLYWGNTKGGNRMGGSIRVDGACYPSKTHFCVTYDLPSGTLPPGRYLVDQGDGRGPQFAPTLLLSAGTPYVFEIIDPTTPSKFNVYPFALTEMDYGNASTPLVEPDGVVPRRGLNPASESGNQLVFTPPVSKGGPYFYQSVRANNMGGKIVIDGACSPSDSHICVSVDDTGYSVNIGDLNGAVKNGPLILTAGKNYTFEVVGSAFQYNPLTIVDDASGVGTADNMVKEGISGDNPADADNKAIKFTPSLTGLRTYYYQSTNQSNVNWGGSITVLGTCIPTYTHICVSFDSADGAYFVTQGEGSRPVKQGTLKLRAGVNFTFEAVGLGFDEHPFVLTALSNSTTLTANDGIIGNTVCVRDGDTITINPAGIIKDPSLIRGSRFYYSNERQDGAGGAIDVAGSCRPTEYSICVTVDGANAVNVNYIPPPSMRTDSNPTGPVPYGELWLQAEKEYTFNMVGGDNLTSITISSDDAGTMQYKDGVYGNNPIRMDGDVLRWSPLSTGPETLYLSSGPTKYSRLRIMYTCTPGPNRICVSVKGNPAKYYVDHGLGPQAGGELKLKTGEVYTFEASGEAFQGNPFALTTDTLNSQNVMVFGVKNLTVINKDGEELVFDTAEFVANLPDTPLYYQCQTVDSMGGSVLVSSDFPVSPPTTPPSLTPTPQPPTIARPPTRGTAPSSPVLSPTVSKPPTTKEKINEQTTSDSSSFGTTIAVVVVVAVLLGLGGAFAFYTWRKRKHHADFYVPLNSTGDNKGIP